jgi:hypothetical protein
VKIGLGCFSLLLVSSGSKRVSLGSTEVLNWDQGDNWPKQSTEKELMLPPLPAGGGHEAAS